MEPKNIEVVLLNCPSAKRITPSFRQFERMGAKLVPDFTSQGELLRAYLSAAAAFGGARHLGAVLPTLYTLESAGQSPKCELVVFPSPHFVSRLIPLELVENLANLKAAFQWAHKLANSEGFASGYPTFELCENKAECIFIQPAAAVVKQVALDTLFDESKD